MSHLVVARDRYKVAVGGNMGRSAPETRLKSRSGILTPAFAILAGERIVGWPVATAERDCAWAASSTEREKQQSCKLCGE